MKKIVSVLLSVLLFTSILSGCGGGNTKKVEGTTEEILQKIYDGLDSSVELPFVMNTKLTNDMGISNDGIKIEYYLGVNTIHFTDGIASEAAIGGAYSVVLLRLDGKADVTKVKNDIQQNVDPNKWICYFADVVIVDNIGDLVILIMTNDQTSPGLGKAIHDSFKKLA